MSSCFALGELLAELRQVISSRAGLLPGLRPDSPTKKQNNKPYFLHSIKNDLLSRPKPRTPDVACMLQSCARPSVRTIKASPTSSPASDDPLMRTFVRFRGLYAAIWICY